MSEVIVIVAPGFEEIEALTVVNVLRRGEVEVSLMSLTQDLSVTGARNITVQADEGFNIDHLRAAHSVILPGGVQGTNNLLASEDLRDFLVSVSTSHLIGAICAAPSVLADAGLLDGKRATSNPDYKDKVMTHPVSYVEDTVVRDGNIVTSRGMGTSLPFALDILEILKGPDVRKQVEQGVVMNSLVDYIRKKY